MSDTLTELYAQTQRLRAAYVAAGIGTLYLDHALFQLEREMEEFRRLGIVSVVHTAGDMDADAFTALDAALVTHPGWFFALQFNGYSGWEVTIWHAPTEIFTHGTTRAEAICKAILALAEQETIP